MSDVTFEAGMVVGGLVGIYLLIFISLIAGHSPTQQYEKATDQAEAIVCKSKCKNKQIDFKRSYYDNKKFYCACLDWRK